jgi:hypothetical protein
VIHWRGTEDTGSSVAQDRLSIILLRSKWAVLGSSLSVGSSRFRKLSGELQSINDLKSIDFQPTNIGGDPRVGPVFYRVIRMNLLILRFLFTEPFYGQR